MVTLTQADKQELERAVADAEKRTSAEIVLAVAEWCDTYRLYTLPYAAFFGLVVLGGLALAMSDTHVRMAFLITGAAVLIAAAVFQWAPVRLALVPRAVREDAAEALARAEFAALVAGRTSAANGVLIFIALAEHHAEIVAEAGLAARVSQETWQKIMDELIAGLKAGRVTDAIKTAVAACGDAAAAVFPAGPDDRNEIADAPQPARPQ